MSGNVIKHHYKKNTWFHGGERMCTTKAQITTLVDVYMRPHCKQLDHILQSLTLFLNINPYDSIDVVLNMCSAWQPEIVHYKKTNQNHLSPCISWTTYLCLSVRWVRLNPFVHKNSCPSAKPSNYIRFCVHRINTKETVFLQKNNHHIRTEAFKQFTASRGANLKRSCR